MEHVTVSIRNRIGIVATALMTASATAGCGGVSANTPPPATAERASDVDDVAAGLMEHHRHHHHGGVTLIIALSLDTLGVSPEQRTQVEKIRRDLLARMEPARVAEQRLATTLADGVAAADLDAAKVDAAIAQVTDAAARVHDASTDALNELHAVLTPPERAALVEKVEAHWAVWQKANAEETDPANPERGRLAMLATDLGLTPDQVDKIRASLGEGMKVVPRLEPQEIAAYLRTFGDAFRSDKFDARVFTTADSANRHLAGWGAAHLAHFVEAVSPVLTPDQRTEYAQRLREHAAHNPSNGGNP
jgi:Spy/CpxP family protein refolding chaperone